MKNLKCLYINIYSSDNQFVYQGPSGKREGAPAQPGEGKEPRLAALQPPPRSPFETAGPPVSEAEKAEQAVKVAKGKGKAAKKTLPPGELAFIPELEDISKLDKEKISKMKRQQKIDTFLKSEGGGTYVINFGGRGTTAERMIGLRHLFDEKTSFLVVHNKYGETLSFAEYRNGNFYNPKTDNRVKIYDGYKIYIPQTSEDLARFKQMAKKEKEALVEAKKQLKKSLIDYISKIKDEKIKDRSVFGGWDDRQIATLADAIIIKGKYSISGPKGGWEKEKGLILGVADYWNDEFNAKRLTGDVQASVLAKVYKPKAPIAPATSAEKEALAKVKKEAEKEKTPEKKLYAYIDNLKGYKITQPQRSIIVKAIFKFKKDFDIDNNNDKKLFNNVLETYILNKNLSVDQLVALADNWNRGIIYRPVAYTKTQEKQRGVAATPGKEEIEKKEPTLKDKLADYISSGKTGFTFSGAETTKLSNALFKFNKDFDVDKTNHRELLHNVCKNYAQNRDLSEFLIVVLATYENMPNAFKEKFKTTLKEDKFQFNFANEIDLKALHKIMKAYRKRPSDMTLQILAALQEERGKIKVDLI